MSFDLTPDEDLRQIVDAAEAMLGSHYPLSRLRMGQANDPIAPLAEFGAFALAVPEAAGGAGFTVLEEAHLHIALGRHLVTPSAVAASVSQRMAAHAGRSDLADQIASGALGVCAGVRVRDGWLLVEGDQADAALLRAGDDLVLADLKQARGAASVASMGQGRAMSLLAAVPDPQSDIVASQAHGHVFDLLVSAQLLGVATVARDVAVDYAKIREQFGRPIGSFQAIKHHCANMHIGVEMLSAQCDMAAIALRDGHEDAGFQIAALQRLAPRIALQNARLGVQIHGGIGFSAEADAQLFIKHAHLLGQLLAPCDMVSKVAPMAPNRKE